MTVTELLCLYSSVINVIRTGKEVINNVPVLHFVSFKPNMYQDSVNLKHVSRSKILFSVYIYDIYIFMTVVCNIFVPLHIDMYLIM